MCAAWVWWHSGRRSETGLGRKLRSFRDGVDTLKTIRPNPRLLAIALLYNIGLCWLNGLGFWVVLQALSRAPVSLSAAVAINAFAWMAGFLAVGAPGGIGIREGTSAVLLAAILPTEDAILVTVAWRLLQIFDELLCVGLCWFLIIPPTTKLVTKLPLIDEGDQIHANR
jgi:uncharacterized protein (TIRG00374 family)